MKLTLLSMYGITSMTLPEKIIGRYWLRSRNNEGKLINIVSVEALLSTESRAAVQWMGDCDMSYDFLHLGGFAEKLREGYPWLWAAVWAILLRAQGRSHLRTVRDGLLHIRYIFFGSSKSRGSNQAQPVIFVRSPAYIPHNRDLNENGGILCRLHSRKRGYGR